ncbi:MAG: bifunctional aspartate kinase/homoserine dehydrogenase I [Bacteroidota bacterium]
MKVLKFGGSSVAKPERIEGIINILKNYYTKGEKFTVVFSAFGGVTDSLIKMSEIAAKGKEDYLDLLEEFKQRHIEAAKSLVSTPRIDELIPLLEENHEELRNLLHGIYLLREASPRTMDYVLSFGERSSSFIIANTMTDRGMKTSYLDARKVVKTDKKFGSATVDTDLTYQKIKEYYAEHPEIQVVTGFIATAKGGLTTTLGRGGSDYTASLLAAGLDAKHIEIWTDVDGVLTCDPRRVEAAFTIPTMTYSEAMEMSHFGAKVIYPPTLQPALKKRIPIYIKNTFNPDFEGTFISDKRDPHGNAVKGISSIGEVALLTLSGSGLYGVPGISGRLFNALALAEVNIILITQGSSENSISFAVSPKSSKAAQKAVEKAFEYEHQMGIVNPIKVENNLSVVAIIGENMRDQPGMAGQMFDALGKSGINAAAIAQGSSEFNISVVIAKEDETKALQALHETFFLPAAKPLNVFVVGTGLIGGTLLDQIGEQATTLKANNNLDIKVVGIADIDGMLFAAEGIDLSNWRTDLKATEEKSDRSIFVGRMKSMNLQNSVFVDNTASTFIPTFYETILESGISISTPNKIAASSEYVNYQRLKQLAKDNGAAYKYEANVGAGLPIISTLNDLMKSGDKVRKIEGVVSGSLSFIFNSFKAGTKFSTIVKQAQELGYTEPDPRDDLSGSDMRRKIMILAREAGYKLEKEDVTIHSILPQAAIEAESVEAFFEVLAQSDAHFEQLRQEADQANKVLRMVAKLDNGEASIGLESFEATHPFYGLNGSDNMIVFTTKRYDERPLVVQGPGAGAAVTAAGVFAEIIKIGINA